MVINSRTDRDSLKWQSPAPPRPPPLFCHKSKSYDRPRYTFIIANGSRNSSYRRITSRRQAGSYSVSSSSSRNSSSSSRQTDSHPATVSCARPNFKGPGLPRRAKYDVRSISRLTFALKERFLKHFRRISYVLES